MPGLVQKAVSKVNGAAKGVPVKGKGHGADHKSHSKSHKRDECPVVRLLPPPLQEQAKKASHLMDYLHATVGDHEGIPEYVEKLSRKMGDNKKPNVIYPVGGNLFIHVFSDAKGRRNAYAAIEPGMLQNIDTLMEEVESRLVDYVHNMEDANSDEEKTDVLLSVLYRVVAVRNGVNTEDPNRWKQKKIDISWEEFEALKYVMIRDKVGLGRLQPIIHDPNIEDISCSGLGAIFVEHKVFDSLKTNITFDTPQELDRFILRLAEKIGRPVTYREPIVDATLPDGSRINIVYGGDVSRRGSNFTIRKFSEKPYSILQLIEFGTISYEMVAYLSLVIAHGQNMFVAGETASGKTTLMNALTTFIPSDAKIVSIEDTPEVHVPHDNWLREVVRGTSKSSQGAEVGMFDLLKAALRQRPNEIIIGEIRGQEGAIAFQAMQTGHSAMATFHASSVEKLIQRLTGDPINVPKTYIDNLNIVVIQSAVQLPNGKPGRRCISVNEIVGYDPTTESFSFLEAFRWDPAKDIFEFKGHLSSYILEERIAPARGLPPQRKREIYVEIQRRARILQKLHQKGVTDFYELFNVLAKAYREGILK